MWSYNTNIDYEMQYFPSHDETVFAIMCVMRFKAVTNEVPDYYIYKDGEYVETLEGDYLYQLYIENGGVTLGVEEHHSQITDIENSQLMNAHTRKKRHLGGKCITIRDDYIAIDYKNSYERLLLETIGEKGILVSQYAIEQSDKIMAKVLSLLTEREGDILNLLYGISESEICGKSRTEVAKLYDTSTDRVKQIEAKALRKLKHPSRLPILLGQKTTDNKSEYNTEHSKKMKQILINEIEEFINVSDAELLYLNKIMERYSITISNETVHNCNLEQLGLSARAYNCLKRAGIDTLADLIKYPDDKLQQIRNIGSKCYKEAKELKNKPFAINKDGYNTITINFNGEKVVYKYLNLDIKQIAKSILDEIQDIEPLKSSLFETQISTRLLELLLVKGYLFFEDVLEDAILLIEQFEKCDLNDIAEEIKELVSNEEKKKQHVYIYPAIDSICKFIKNNNCISASDFICKANSIDDEKIQNLLQELRENGFSK